MSWDNSPVQYSLTPSPPILEVNSAPPTPLTKAPTKLSRRNAISENTLARSDAFRHPPDHVPFKNSIPTMHFRRSRIPRPTTTSNMDLHQVADISLLPYPSETPYNLRSSTTRQRYRDKEQGDQAEWRQRRRK